MGRLRVTPKGKRASNVPITRIGKKQYLKRRFAHVRKVDLAGKDNRFTQKYVQGSHTAMQSYTRLGISMDPSVEGNRLKDRKKNIKQHMKARLEEEAELAEQQAMQRRTKIGRPVSEQEGSTIANLISKYGTDVKRMSLDRKLNPFQLNPRQLQRSIVNYLSWERAAFPEAFAEAEANGWFSVEQFKDPKLRNKQHKKGK